MKKMWRCVAGICNDCNSTPTCILDRGHLVKGRGRGRGSSSGSRSGFSASALAAGCRLPTADCRLPSPCPAVCRLPPCQLVRGHQNVGYNRVAWEGRCNASGIWRVALEFRGDVPLFRGYRLLHGPWIETAVSYQYVLCRRFIFVCRKQCTRLEAGNRGTFHQVFFFKFPLVTYKCPKK